MTRLILAALLLTIAAPAGAQIPMTGRFVAEARCPALASLVDPANPGTVATEPGAAYALLARNGEPTTHYLLQIPGAEPARRWVAVGCGRIEAADATAAS
ncbi:hypothetical protein VQ042_06665 [Aurantimonas sp. A2-1-M11]|uniref:hypothetical protein n=1 Tax=Aurantimonas sp. A2-1-M11 TaxID=3113712 RepID=UPI002F95D48A